MLMDAVAVADLEPDAGVEPLPGPRKLGGILKNQLSHAFASLEARYLLEARLCVVCKIAPRDDGRSTSARCHSLLLRIASVTQALGVAVQSILRTKRNDVSGRDEARASARGLKVSVV
jgi:hypothetical protein